MALDSSNSSSLEQLALKGLKSLELFKFNVRLSQWSGRTVPYSGNRDWGTPVSKSSECSLNGEDVGVSRAKLMASRYSNRLLVVSRVRCVLTTQRLVDDGGQLVVDSLFHWQPVQAPENCTGETVTWHPSEGAPPQSFFTLPSGGYQALCSGENLRTNIDR